MKSILITVEGPIGIGKTSLARELSRAFELQLLEEIVYENPFLGKFYENIAEWSFQLEMFFLCNRYKQLQDIHSKYLQQNQSVVSDYNIFKNTIFSKRTLSDDNLNKYLKIYDILTENLPQAHLVIYLTASIDTVMKRIAMRDRDVERSMDVAYMENLIADYEEFMDAFEKQHPDIPVIKFDCDHLDFVHKPEDLRYVLERIEPKVKELMAE
ncbi:deoxynucleoside kinase [Brevibacillus invocatus]|uniref:deoxynucleoside kinase n=1 Tax=Brevibacillus invocatus TaxID=173959 RepID=UPI00203DB53D|nr:deoxynucleoside kinase [Brevibacillus invocatus]MCM3080994.1 deoxynucleoside kinase [Brevibacillus invocatus]MCM3431285.1 deoxynucleoside kinase [Brevibacillus invocatus]